MPDPLPFRVVQPWGSRKKIKESTAVSSHRTAAEAFAAIDTMAARMIATGAPSHAVELIVLDADDEIVRRPDAH